MTKPYDPAKEQRELAHLNREMQRPKGAYYLLFAMIVLTVIYIVDEITSNVNSAMQPYALFDLFLCIGVPFMAVSLVLLMTKVKETKDVDLDSITPDTFR